MPRPRDYKTLFPVDTVHGENARPFRQTLAISGGIIFTVWLVLSELPDNWLSWF